MGTGNDEEGLVNDQLRRRVTVETMERLLNFQCVWMRVLVGSILLIANRKNRCFLVGKRDGD